MEEGRSNFLSIVQNTYKEASERLKKEAQEEYEKQTKQAGPNPFQIKESPELSAAILFLEKALLDAASKGNNYVIIDHMDIPGIVERIKAVESYPILAKKDAYKSTHAIIDAFRAAHPEFVPKSHKDCAEIVFFLQHGFKISF